MGTNKNILLAGLAAMAAMDLLRTTRFHVRTLCGRDHEHPLWENVQLSKAERRGKTPQEIQALRQAKWEQQCREWLEEGDLPDD